ncbi:hypothetical protein CYY_003569 [Polysphondylium violaceum]|uniref:THH1/TOM1/TOM3 domain-containing protein n=1 Tax=Polysphondylium violaceum TaxID=133409 RepID=A0A8J4V8K0_9MYCE|nr:hypothetical protein CYY_003569 [Polysphondylium violaceum]
MKYQEDHVKKCKQQFTNLKRLKTIPFLVFTSCAIGVVFRIATGFLAFPWDVSSVHYNRWVLALYAWAVQFYCFEFYFIALLWIKLAVVYFNGKDLPLNRIKMIDGIILGNIIVSLIFHTGWTVVDLVIFDKADMDAIWRIYFLASVLLLSVGLGYFGLKLLYLLSKTSKGIDGVLMAKIKYILCLTTFLGVYIWTLNLIFLIHAKNEPLEDWINLLIFIAELVNCFMTQFILGRSSVCIRLRILMGCPEMIDDTSTNASEMNASGPASTIEISLDASSISTNRNNSPFPSTIEFDRVGFSVDNNNNNNPDYQS